MKSMFSYFKNFSLKKFLYLCVLISTFIYVFSVPSFGEKTNWQHYIIYASMLLITVTSVLYIFLYDKFLIPKCTLFIPAFVIFAFLGTVLYSHDYRSWISLLLLVISFYSFLLSFKIIKNKYLVISIVSIAFLLFGLFYIFIYRNEFIHFVSVLSGKYRLGSYFDNPNGVGAYAVVAFATSLYLVLFLKKKIRYFFIFPSLVSVLVGISTGSRTFYLIVLVVIAVFLYFFFKKHKFIYLIVLVSLIVVSIVLLNLPALSFLKERVVLSFQTMFGMAVKADTSTIQRANYIQYGFYLGSKNLLTGYGVNGFSIISGVGTYSHCNFSELLCNFGVVGFVLFYSPLLILFVKALINKKIDKGFIVSFFAYYLIVSFTNVLYYKKIYYLVLAFMFYLVYYNEQEKNVPVCEKPEKIVFTCDALGSGGAERVVVTLANSFVERGVDVKIIGVSDRINNNTFSNLDHRISYIPLCYGRRKRVNSFNRIRLLRNKLKNIHPDIVISFLPHVNFYSMIACKLLKIPYIVSERNDPKRDPKGFIIKLFKYISFMQAEGCVFQNEGARNYYYSSIRDKSIIIRNPLNLRYVPRECIQDKDKIVLAVGRLTQQKNYKNLLNAFKIFNEEFNYEFSLNIYGEGPLKNELASFAKSLKIDNNVRFLGVDENWHQKEYRDAMYVLSSDYEGMPNSLIEAMALGIPSVSTNCPCGGPGEIITDGVNGFLVPVNDYNLLAKAMIRIASVPCNGLWNETRRMIIDYSIETISTQWLNYIKGLRKIVYE